MLGWGCVNTCFALTTVMNFSQNKARAAQQSKLYKRVTMGWVKFHLVSPGFALKRECSVARLRRRETSVNRTWVIKFTK